MVKQRTNRPLVMLETVVGLLALAVLAAFFVSRGLNEQALSAALSANSPLGMERALARGADPNMRWSPYHDALLPAPSGYETPISIAVANNNPVMVEVLLKYGADPNTCVPGGATLLAAAKGKPALERMLRKAGARE